MAKKPMALPRKDLRLKLDADDHAALLLIAESEESELAEWAERILTGAIRRRVHAAMLLSDKAKRLGIQGKPLPAED